MLSFNNFNGDEQERKLFVGGLNKITEDDQLRHFFGKYGEVVDCNIMRDQEKRSRGFGFILFDDATAVDKIIAAKKDGSVFMVDDRTIEIKRALPKVPRGTAGAPRAERLNKKIFVGGLPNTIAEDEVRAYFENYGKVNEVQLIKDRETGKLRGFAFITFDDEDSADKCLQRRAHEICKKMCEVKRAQTRAKEQDRISAEKKFEGATTISNENGRGAVSVPEVNRLIQQAFLMGQQGTFQGTPLQVPAPSNSILHVLRSQQVHNNASASPRLNTTSTLSQLAQLLQSGGLDTNALGPLLKEPESQRSSTTSDIFTKPPGTYVAGKEEYVPAAKRAFRPY